MRRGAGFALPAEFDTPADTEAVEASPIAAATLSAILGGPIDHAAPQDQDAAAGRHGHALLDALARLQLASLGLLGSRGDRDEAGQSSLAGLVQKMPDAVDPGLRDVLQAIAARAAIELARRV